MQGKLKRFSVERGLEKQKMTQKKNNEIELRIVLDPAVKFFFRQHSGAVYFHDLINDVNLFTSEKTSTLVGYTEEEILNLPDGIRGIIHKDDLNEVLGMNELVLNLKDGECAQAVYRIKDNEGNWKWLKSEEYVYKRNESGKPIICFGIAHDVTSEKQKEERLQKLLNLEAFQLEISTLLSDLNTDRQSVLKEFTKRVSIFFNAGSDIFILNNEGRIEPVAWYHPRQVTREKLGELLSREDRFEKGFELLEGILQAGGEFVMPPNDPRLKEFGKDIDPDLRASSFMYIALTGRDEALGALGLTRLEKDPPFNETELNEIRLVVKSLTLFLNNRIVNDNYRKELDRREKVEKELLILNRTREFQLELSTLLSNLSVDQGALLKKLAKRLANHFNAGSDIYLINDEDLIEPVAWYHSKAAVRKKLNELLSPKKNWQKKSEENLGELLDSRGEFIMRPDDPELAEMSKKVDVELQASSFMYATFVGRDGPFGVLGLTRLKEDPPFNEQEHEEIRQVVRSLSLFLDNRVIHEQHLTELKRREIAEAELIDVNRFNAFQLKVSMVLSDLTKSSSEILFELTRLTSGYFNAVSDLHIIDDEQILQPVAWYHIKKSVREKVGKMFKLGRFKVGQGVLGNVASSCKEYVLQNMPKEFKHGLKKLDKEIRACSFIYLPLKGHKEVIATLGLTRLEGQQEFNDKELEHIRLVANTIALFLDNRVTHDRHRSELERRKKAESELKQINLSDQFLLETVEIISNFELSKQEILDLMCKHLSGYLKTTTAVHLVNRKTDTLDPVALSDIDQKKEKTYWKLFKLNRIKLGNGRLGKVIATGKEVLVENISGQERNQVKPELRDLVPECSIMCPLQGSGEVLGVLTLERGTGMPKFSEKELITIRELAGFVGPIIDNHLLYEQREVEIGKRRSAEKLLRQQNIEIEKKEEDLRSILNTMPILVSRLDTDYTFRFANAAFQTSLGIDPDWVVGKSINNVVSNEFLSRLKPEFEKAKSGQICTFSTSGTMADGSFHYFDVVLSPDYDSNGIRRGILTCVEDTTDQARTHQKLELSEQRLRLIFENIDDHIITVSPQGEVESINKTIDGFVPNDVIGRSIFDFYSEEENVLMLKDKFEELKRTGKPFSVEHSYAEANKGNKIFLYDHRFIGVFKNKQLIKVIVIARDITGERNREHEVLTAMVKGQETERKRVAAEMHDGVGQILAAISIQLSVLSMAKGKVAPRDILSVAEKVQHGITEVRNVSHALKPDVLVNFGLVPAIEEVCNTLSSPNGTFISFNHIDVEKRFAENIEINIYRITQELLTNCLKHAKAHDVFVTLIIDEKKLILTVEDDGKGFDKKDQTGIGMNNIRSRLKLINGSILIDSAAGKGSLINIEVPL